jgi:hypothetical protein
MGGFLGLLVSKVLWNYALSPPSVELPSGSAPQAFGLYRVGAAPTVVAKQNRVGELKHEFRRCRTGDECTYGRTLSALGIGKLEALPELPAHEASDAIAIARRLSSVEFFRQGSGGVGIVVAFENHHTFVGFQTNELAHDTHGYVECVLDNRADASRLESEVSYYFDVAGIEFATPGVLVVLGALLAVLIMLVSMALMRFVAALVVRTKPPLRRS